jgi:3-oxoacyl-[acyl-carrier protein] reductase
LVAHLRCAHNMFRLDGKVALITGVRDGIGAEIAHAFAQAGANLMLANRSAEAREAVASRIRALGRDVRTIDFSATDDACKAAVRRTVEAFGGIDVLVHNAGGCTWTSLEAMTSEILEATLALNLKCCFWLTQAAVPVLRLRGEGRVLITSSVTGPRVAMAHATAYAAAKAGVNGFIRAAALELAPDGITVNGVEPGFIAKDHGRLSDTSVRTRIERYIPLGRMGKAKEVAAAFLFLASTEARWITGQTIVVDGGSILPDSGYAMEEMRAAQGAQGERRNGR